MEKVSSTVGAVRNGCLVYEQQGQNVVVLLDTPSWYAWLETATHLHLYLRGGNVYRAQSAVLAIGAAGGTGEPIVASEDDSPAVTWASPPISRWRNCVRRPAAWQQMLKAPEAGKQMRTRRLFRTFPSSLQGLTSTVILQTTITPPRLPVPHVARPRLLALLEQGLRGPLTLVSAPAGSGKTTLLAEWAAMTTRPVAWLSCEEGENDPARFLSSLIAALARLDERLGIAAKTDRPWHPSEHERVLTRLLNDLERVLPARSGLDPG